MHVDVYYVDRSRHRCQPAAREIPKSCDLSQERKRRNFYWKI